MVKGDFLLQYRDEEVVGLYNYTKDRLLHKNLKGKLPKIQADIEKQMKAFIQQYNNLMNAN